MDNLIVNNPIELALAWGSSPEELSDDVFEHSACGISLTGGHSAVVVCAAVSGGWTRERTLLFPFSMAEFEVLLRTVEQDAQGAMSWENRKRGIKHRSLRPEIKRPQRKTQSKEVRRPSKESVGSSFNDGLDNEDDIGLLWTVPREVMCRSHVDLGFYEKELNEVSDWGRRGLR